MARISKKEIAVVFLCLSVFIFLPLFFYVYFSYRNFDYHGYDYSFEYKNYSQIKLNEDSAFSPVIPMLLNQDSIDLKNDSKINLLRNGYALEATNLSYLDLLNRSTFPVYLTDKDISFFLKGMEESIKIKIRDEIVQKRIENFKLKFLKKVKEKESLSYLYSMEFKNNLLKNKSKFQKSSSSNDFNINEMDQKQLQNFKYLVKEANLKEDFENIISLIDYSNIDSNSNCELPRENEYIITEINKDKLSEAIEELRNIMKVNPDIFVNELGLIDSYEEGTIDEKFLLNYSCYVDGQFNLSIIDNNGTLNNQIIDKAYVLDEINNKNFSEKYDYEPIAQYPGTVRIPIFMYHQITQVPPTATGYAIGLYVTPEIFEQQMAYLVSKNYKSISPKEFYDQLTTGRNPDQKTVMITFDDASYGQYQNAYPILKKYGLIGVFYIPTFKSSISKAQLKEMADNGMIIDSHTRTHPNLQKEDDIVKLTEEIGYSRADLASFTGKQSYSIAYPGCVADKEALSVVASSGYLLGVSCGRGIDHSFVNRLVLSRVHVFNDMKSFKKLLSGIN